MENTLLQFPKRRNLEPIFKDGKRVSYLFRSKRTGDIFYRQTFSKLKIKPINASTGEKVLGRAKVKAELMLQHHKNVCLGVNDSHIFGRERSKTLGEVGREFLEKVTENTHAKTKLRDSTKIQHYQYIEEIIKLWGFLDINALDPALPNTEYESMRSSGRRTTFGLYAKYLNMLVRYAYNRKYASHLIKFPNPDSGPKPGRYYTAPERKAIWEAASEDMRDQIVLAFENVMRLQEMLRLIWDRVDLKTGKLTLLKEHVKTGSKTGRGRVFIMSPGALTRLRARRERSPDTVYVFPSRNDHSLSQGRNQTAWERIKDTVGIDGRARWHDWRHTGLTVMLLEKKLNPLLVSEFAGAGLSVIQKTYLKPDETHTIEVGMAVRIEE